MSGSDKSDKPLSLGRRKGIYLLPNLFTSASLFAGFYAIVAAMNHQFDRAAIAIFIALICDGLDGRVARLINAQSAFGAQYDSLSDMLSFGVTPALVLYNWSLLTLGQHGLGKIGWLTSFLYVACVALRLAKFNTQVESALPAAKRYFFGLPCPAGAAFVASSVWFGDAWHLGGLWLSWLTVIVSVLVSLLMVSNIRYRSFKDIDLKVSVRFTKIIIMVIVLICIAWRPNLMLFVIFAGYILSGPIFGLMRLLKKRRVKRQEHL